MDWCCAVDVCGLPLTESVILYIQEMFIQFFSLLGPHSVCYQPGLGHLPIYNFHHVGEPISLYFSENGSWLA